MKNNENQQEYWWFVYIFTLTPKLWFKFTAQTKKIIKIFPDYCYCSYPSSASQEPSVSGLKMWTSKTSSTKNLKSALTWTPARTSSTMKHQRVLVIFVSKQALCWFRNPKVYIILYVFSSSIFLCLEEYSGEYEYDYDDDYAADMEEVCLR